MDRTTPPPTLHTARLLLRPFEMADAPRVQALAGDPLVARTTATIPHPYPDGAAEEWIGQHAEWWRDRGHVSFALVTHDDGLVGCFSLLTQLAHRRAELGYWIGPPFWGRGYCTEAGRAICGFGFDVMGLHRINACHIACNPASGRVMTKLGLVHEGTFRQHHWKDGHTHDLVYYGLLAGERQQDQHPDKA